MYVHICIYCIYMWGFFQYTSLHSTSIRVHSLLMFCIVLSDAAQNSDLLLPVPLSLGFSHFETLTVISRTQQFKTKAP